MNSDELSEVASISGDLAKAREDLDRDRVRLEESILKLEDLRQKSEQLLRIIERDATNNQALKFLSQVSFRLKGTQKDIRSAEKGVERGEQKVTRLENDLKVHMTGTKVELS